jgi:hypothetical protein
MVDGWVPVPSDSVNTLLWSNGLLRLQRAFRVRSTLESIQSDSKFPATQGSGFAASKCRRDISFLLEIGLRWRILLNGPPCRLRPASGKELLRCLNQKAEILTSPPFCRALE